MISGQVSYAAQESWLFGGTLKQNVLFGEEFEAERYAEVLRCCGLERNLTLWPRGDATIVGERGVALSGGQKVIVNQLIKKINLIFIFEFNLL